MQKSEADGVDTDASVLNGRNGSTARDDMDDDDDEQTIDNPVEETQNTRDEAYFEVALTDKQDIVVGFDDADEEPSEMEMVHPLPTAEENPSTQEKKKPPEAKPPSRSSSKRRNTGESGGSGRLQVLSEDRYKSKLQYSQERKWNYMFKRLLKFKERFGHVLVPNRFEEDPSLGSWVSTQRRQRKVLVTGKIDATAMTPRRAQLLESIGFVWETKDPRQVPWEVRYQQLVEFKEKHGHAVVPMANPENLKLANWVSTQRQEGKMLREGRASRLTPEKVKMLDALGFAWVAPRGVSTQLKRLRQGEKPVPYEFYEQRTSGRKDNSKRKRSSNSTKRSSLSSARRKSRCSRNSTTERKESMGTMSQPSSVNTTLGGAAMTAGLSSSAADGFEAAHPTALHSSSAISNLSNQNESITQRLLQINQQSQLNSLVDYLRVQQMTNPLLLNPHASSLLSQSHAIGGLSDDLSRLRAVASLPVYSLRDPLADMAFAHQLVAGSVGPNAGLLSVLYAQQQQDLRRAEAIAALRSHANTAIGVIDPINHLLRAQQSQANMNAIAQPPATPMTGSRAGGKGNTEPTLDSNLLRSHQQKLLRSASIPTVEHTSQMGSGVEELSPQVERGLDTKRAADASAVFRPRESSKENVEDEEEDDDDDYN